MAKTWWLKKNSFLFDGQCPAPRDGHQACACGKQAVFLDISRLACLTMHLRRLLQAASTSMPRGAAPEMMVFKLDRSNLSTTGCFARPRMMGGTKCALVHLCSWMPEPHPCMAQGQRIEKVTSCSVIPAALFIIFIDARDEGRRLFGAPVKKARTTRSTRSTRTKRTCEEGAHVEGGHGHDAAPLEEGDVEAGHEAVDVEERQRRDHHL